ncbi:aspartic peptidase domain-containing protein [Syncephalastrum racemosum]|uniref:Aspartic peptidase domain-containing protein n=1 Tax=Syncephalastrum racemosum TaxID=13706 RepID=A0A1X2HJH9_SYNRA|nr:aspartic peptidase domain-containing protein [Syncephalastrum racemosum]
MYFLNLASAALMALTFWQGADSAAVSKNQVVRLPLTRNEAGHLAQLRRNFGKRADTQPLYNALGREYLVEVGVGSPEQKFNLTLDTGSAELWIPTTSCPATTCPYDRFDTKKSKTFKLSSMSFSIEYGIGSAKGTYAHETVTVGAAKVTNQTVGMVNSTENILGVVSGGEQSNGILGMGYPGLNTARGSSNDKPFAFNLASQLQDPVFSIFLNKHFAYGLSGEIMFGGIDTAKFKGSLEYVPVAQYDMSSYLVSANLGKTATRKGDYLYWTVAGQGIQAGSYKATFPEMQGLILDTGTTLTMVPKAYVEGILKAVAGSGKYKWDALNSVYRVDCGLVKSTENVMFQISTDLAAAASSPVTLSTPMSELVIPLDTNSIETATSCMFGITQASSSLTSGDTWILGEASLRSIYAVYDMKNNRVGLAPVNLEGATQVTPTSSTSSVNSNSNNTTSSTDSNTVTGNSSGDDDINNASKKNASQNDDDAGTSAAPIMQVSTRHICISAALSLVLTSLFY